MKQALSFKKCLKDLSSSKWNENSPEPLASTDYKEECELKEKAFNLFLKKSGIEKLPEVIVPSPRPRNYRTTTKRRVSVNRGELSFGFAVNDNTRVAKSPLEPVEHQQIYIFLHETLSSKSFSALSRALNWVIIRGNYERQFLILNIFKMDGNVVRKMKQLCDVLQKEKKVEGAMAYFDPTRSDYYLEAERPRGLQIKHLFGPRLLGLRVGDILMRYSPVGFSQINESMVHEMVRLAEELLSPDKDDQFLDLYCGYGLFSHTVGSKCKKVTGVELSSEAVNSAREITKRLKVRNRMNFYAEKIDPNLIRNKLEPAQNELILLDPPRKGCEPGVISQLAGRKPKRVLHIFCGTDEIPSELKQWQKFDYVPKIIQPLDMFAGTANLETMVLLEKK